MVRSSKSIVIFSLLLCSSFLFSQFGLPSVNQSLGNLLKEISSVLSILYISVEKDEYTTGEKVAVHITNLDEYEGKWLFIEYGTSERVFQTFPRRIGEDDFSMYITFRIPMSADEGRYSIRVGICKTPKCESVTYAKVDRSLSHEFRVKPRKHKAVWLYKDFIESKLLKYLNDPKGMRESIREMFVKNGIDVIFMSYVRDIKKEFYQAFNRMADEEGIYVMCATLELSGEDLKSFISSDYSNSKLIEEILKYNMEVDEPERFRGIITDIEFQTIGKDPTGYEGIHEVVREVIGKRMEYATAISLYCSKEFLNDMKKIMDFVVIMSYDFSKAYRVLLGHMIKSFEAVAESLYLYTKMKINSGKYLREIEDKYARDRAIEIAGASLPCVIYLDQINMKFMLGIKGKGRKVNLINRALEILESKLSVYRNCIGNFIFRGKTYFGIE